MNANIFRGHFLVLKISKNRKLCPCLIMALAENKQEQKNLSLLNFGICLNAVPY